MRLCRRRRYLALAPQADPSPSEDRLLGQLRTTVRAAFWGQVSLPAPTTGFTGQKGEELGGKG